MNIPESVSNLEKSLLDILYVKSIAENMELKDKVDKLEKKVKSLNRKINRHGAKSYK